jgi:hypothetical protein
MNFVREFVEDEFIKIIFAQSKTTRAIDLLRIQIWKPTRDIMENMFQI